MHFSITAEFNWHFGSLGISCIYNSPFFLVQSLEDKSLEDT